MYARMGFELWVRRTNRMREGRAHGVERLSSKEEVRTAVGAARREGKRIGLVPTMGALHEGHLSLVRASCARADYTAVSIFVNPTQFSDAADLKAYPRDLDRDLELLAAEGVDLVFVPGERVMYAPDAMVSVEPGPLANVLEGASRPGHFSGVCTVVTKLLNIVRPDLAFFGEKDYQQLKIVERLVRDLDLPVSVVARPTVRERDGLAMSSRNSLLTSAERTEALALCESLEAAAAAIAWGERAVAAIKAAMTEEFASRPSTQLDYAVLVDPETLEPLHDGESVVPGSVLRALVAARVGGVRLIDNAPLLVPEEA